MRILKPLAGLLLFAPVLIGTAFAQTPMTGNQGVGTSATSPLSGTSVHPGMAPAATRGVATAGKTPKKRRMTLAQRFSAANTSHDGHLTLAQAQAANWRRVVKNYAEIDTGRQGYVTLAEIHAYNQAQYRAHRHPKAKASQ